MLLNNFYTIFQYAYSTTLSEKVMYKEALVHINLAKTLIITYANIQNVA